MSSDGGGGGGAGDAAASFFEGDAELEAARSAISATATAELSTGRDQNVGYWGRRNAAAEAVQEKYDLDRSLARGVAKEAQLEMPNPVAVDVFGFKIREDDLIASAFEPVPFVTRAGSALAEMAWDADIAVEDPDIGQGFDAGGLPDIPGVEAAGPGPDLVTPAPGVVETGGTTPDTGGGGGGGAGTDAGPTTPDGPRVTPRSVISASRSRPRRQSRSRTTVAGTLGAPTTIQRKTLLGA